MAGRVVVRVGPSSCVDVDAKRVTLGAVVGRKEVELEVDDVLVGLESRQIFEALGLKQGRANYVVSCGARLRGRLRCSQVPSPLRSLAAERPRLFRDVHTGDAGVFAHAVQWVAEVATQQRDAGCEASPELSTARDWVHFASVDEAVRMIRRAARPSASLVVRLRCNTTSVTLVDLEPRDRLVLHRCVRAAARGEFVPSRESLATRALASAFEDATYVITVSDDRAEAVQLLDLAADARRLVLAAPRLLAAPPPVAPATLTTSRASQTDEPLPSLLAPLVEQEAVDLASRDSNHTSLLVQHYEAIIQGLQARLVERQVTIRNLRAQLHCQSSPGQRLDFASADTIAV